MTVAITTSCQLRPQPHANGTAARSARNGIVMKPNRAICSTVTLRLSLGAAPLFSTDVELSRIDVSSWRPRASVVVLAGEVVMGSAPSGEKVTYATVTYAIVGSLPPRW